MICKEEQYSNKTRIQVMFNSLRSSLASLYLFQFYLFPKTLFTLRAQFQGVEITDNQIKPKKLSSQHA